jgi:hypothetical protein
MISTLTGRNIEEEYPSFASCSQGDAEWLHTQGGSSQGSFPTLHVARVSQPAAESFLTTFQGGCGRFGDQLGRPMTTFELLSGSF